MIGYLGFSPEKYIFPVSATSIKKSCVVIQSDHVYCSGAKVCVIFLLIVERITCSISDHLLPIKTN